MKHIWAGAAAFAIACGRTPAPKAGAADGRATRTDTPAVVATMPSPPPAASGALRLVSSGPDDVNGTILARAALCDVPGVLLVQGNQDGFGVLVMLALPDPSKRIGRYPVTYTIAGPARLPEAPAAQVAVQRLGPKGATAFQGLEGNVELYGLGEKASGRFQVSLREISSQRIDRVAGTFSDVPLQRQPATYCQGLSGSADSGRDGR